MELNITRIVSGKMKTKDDEYLQIYVEAVNSDGVVAKHSFFANGKQKDFWMNQNEIAIIDKKSADKQQLIKQLMELDPDLEIKEKD